MMIFVFGWAVRSAIVIAIAALLVGALRVKDSSARLAAWTAALCGSLAIPVLMLAVPSIPLIVPGAASAPPVLIQPMRAPFASPAVIPLHLSPPRQHFDWALAALAIYGAIGLALLARLVTGLVMSRRILRRAAALEIAGVRESTAVGAPVTLGILRPSIILPPDWRDWDASKLAAVLAHERSHIERSDPLVQFLSSLHQAALWFSPLSWHLHRRIVCAAEEASDDAAVAAINDRTHYAEVLLDFMRYGVRGRLHGIAMARYGDPEKRIARVLDGAASQGLTRSSFLAILALALPLTAIIAAAHPQRAAQVPAAQQAATVIPTPPVPQALTAPRASVASARDRAAVAATASAAPSGLPAEAAFQARAAQGAEVSEPQAQSASSDSIRSYIVSFGNGSFSMGSWNENQQPDPDSLTLKYGRLYAWFRQGDREYIVTDPGFMDEVKDAMEPQREVNRLQQNVNAEQSKVNALQNGVNLQQHDVNAMQSEVNRLQDMVNRLQSAVNNGGADEVLRRLEDAIKDLNAHKNTATQNDVRRAQDRVNDSQARVNEEQQKVNALQAEVNDAQRAANVKIRNQLYEIFQSAIDRNLARRIN